MYSIQDLSDYLIEYNCVELAECAIDNVLHSKVKDIGPSLFEDYFYEVKNQIPVSIGSPIKCLVNYNEETDGVFDATCECGGHVDEPCLHMLSVFVYPFFKSGIDKENLEFVRRFTSSSFQSKNGVFVEDKKGKASSKTKKEKPLTAKLNLDIPRKTRPYYLPSYDRITQELVKMHSSASAFNSARINDYTISDVDVKTDMKTIEFTIAEKSYWGRPEVKKVTFSVVDDTLKVSNSEYIMNKKLSVAEVFILLHIASSPTPNLFSALDSKEYRYSRFKDVCTRYGIDTQEEFDKYTTDVYDLEKGLCLGFRDKVLLSLDGTDPSTPLDHLFNLKEEKNDFGQFVDAISTTKRKAKNSIAFVLIGKDPDSDPYYNRDYSGINLMYGTLNKAKTGFVRKLSSFDIDESTSSFEMNDSSKELLELLRSSVDRGGDISSRTKQKRIFELLRSADFVYYLADSTPYKHKKKDLVPVGFSENNITFSVKVSKEGELLQLDASHDVKGREINFDNYLCITPFLYINRQKKIYFCEQESNEETKFLSKQSFAIKKEGKQLFFDKYIEPLAKYYPIQYKKGTFVHKVNELDFEKRAIYLSEHEDAIIMRPAVVYDDKEPMPLMELESVLDFDGKNTVTELVRNYDMEDEFNEEIAELHPEFADQKQRKAYALSYDDFTYDHWFFKFFEKMEQEEVEVFGLKDLKKFRFSQHQASVSTSVTSGIDWFDVRMDVSFGDEKLKLKDLRRAVINQEKYVQLKDGTIGVLPDEWLNKLDKYFRHGKVNKEKLEISKLRFSIVDELFDEIDDKKTLKEITAKKKRLKEFTEIATTEIPETVNAELRHYQKEGVNWLNFLHDMTWGGILADDMGLGKTLQMLTFLKQVLQQNSQTNLIVVPTSLLFNWQNEIEKFVPCTKVLFHYGTDRAKDTTQFDEYDLVIVSYGVMLRDVELLKDFAFNYVVLDESQAIKNPSSRRYKAACLLQANNRIAMTGTPIENNTFDLFAQMSFANRGMLGGMKDFKDQFSNPIDKDSNEQIASELQRMIDPFVLRRTKEKVAKELPPKVEDVIFCEMGKEQRDAYDLVKNEFRTQILSEVDGGNLNSSKMMILEGLTRLRQICDAPQLINRDDVATKESVKLKEIVSQITEKTGKHKVLIFSQFTGMLSLVKSELAKKNIDYEYLDGKSSSKKREKSVDRFQNNDDLRVFLISLKAGGTGLNLTAADYVYILDPWWNPAVEAQAIDRCYRIGQDKSVFAYRMICKDTIEEKILLLQKKKRQLASDIIHTEENIMKTIDRDDIQDLFS